MPRAKEDIDVSVARLANRASAFYLAHAASLRSRLPSAHVALHASIASAAEQARGASSCAPILVPTADDSSATEIRCFIIGAGKIGKLLGSSRRCALKTMSGVPAISAAVAALGNVSTSMADPNLDVCASCLSPTDDLVCCDGCPRSVCLGCLGLTTAPEISPWLCGDCATTIPDVVYTAHAAVRGGGEIGGSGKGHTAKAAREATTAVKRKSGGGSSASTLPFAVSVSSSLPPFQSWQRLRTSSAAPDAPNIRFIPYVEDSFDDLETLLAHVPIVKSWGGDRRARAADAILSAAAKYAVGAVLAAFGHNDTTVHGLNAWAAERATAAACVRRARALEIAQYLPETARAKSTKSAESAFEEERAAALGAKGLDFLASATHVADLMLLPPDWSLKLITLGEKFPAPTPTEMAAAAVVTGITLPNPSTLLEWLALPPSGASLAIECARRMVPPTAYVPAGADSSRGGSSASATAHAASAAATSALFSFNPGQVASSVSSKSITLRAQTSAEFLSPDSLLPALPAWMTLLVHPRKQKPEAASPRGLPSALAPLRNLWCRVCHRFACAVHPKPLGLDNASVTDEIWRKRQLPAALALSIEDAALNDETLSADLNLTFSSFTPGVPPRTIAAATADLTRRVSEQRPAVVRALKVAASPAAGQALAAALKDALPSLSNIVSSLVPRPVPRRPPPRTAWADAPTKAWWASSAHDLVNLFHGSAIALANFLDVPLTAVKSATADCLSASSASSRGDIGGARSLAEPGLRALLVHAEADAARILIARPHIAPKGCIYHVQALLALRLMKRRRVLQAVHEDQGASSD